MTEAVVAAACRVAIQTKGLACDNCASAVAAADGALEFFAETCTAEQCELHRYRALPSVKEAGGDLWAWFDELIDWQRGGLDAMVSGMLSQMPVSHVRAFVAFRRALCAEVEAFRDAQARSGPGPVGGDSDGR